MEILILIGIVVLSIIISTTIMGLFYYALWGYLPWWPEEQKYDHRCLEDEFEIRLRENQIMKDIRENIYLSSKIIYKEDNKQEI